MRSTSTATTNGIAAQVVHAQRRTLGTAPDKDPAQLIAELREHIHSLAAVCAALKPYFELGQPVRGPYLHSWELLPTLREPEVELIAQASCPRPVHGWLRSGAECVYL